MSSSTEGYVSDSSADWIDLAQPSILYDKGPGTTIAPGHTNEALSLFAYRIEGTDYIISVSKAQTLTDTTKWSNIPKDIGTITFNELASRLNEGTSPPPPANDPKGFQEDVIIPTAEAAEQRNALSWVNIKVGDTMFTAPSCQFLKYKFFRTLINAKSSKSGSIRIRGICADEFRTLIKLLYPWDQEQPELSKAQWITVLKLATTWNIPELRERAINKIKTYAFKRHLEYFRLGKEFNVPDWLHWGLSGLIQEEADISSADATNLGLPATVAIHHAREALYGDYYTQYRDTMAPSSNGVSARALQDLVDSETKNQPRDVDVFEKIRQARELGVPDLLLAAYHELTEREASLTLEEVEKLGLSTALSIWSARIALRKEYKEKIETVCNISYPVDLESILGTVFGNELNVDANALDRPDPPCGYSDPKPFSSPSGEESTPEPQVLPE